MIIFKYVRWRNLLSTGNQFTEIQLDRNNTTLIIGENGAGKSTILDALCFGLFGKPFRNMNKPLLVNSVNNNSCVVEVEFEIGSKKIKVIRGIKPNIFEIYLNGIMYNQDANVRDYQKYLEQQILKLNYRSFTQVVILGSSTFVPFMQLKARHRREVVNEILDIQIFSIMNLVMRERLKTLVADLRENEYQCALAEEKIALQNKYIEDVKKNKTTLVKEKTALISTNEEEIAKRQENVENLKKSNEDLSFNSENATEQTEKIQKLKGIHEQLKVKRSATNKYIDFFEKNDDCPTCEQHIDETFKDNMIVSKKTEYEKFDTGIKELIEELERQETINEAIQDYIRQIRENDAEIGKINFSIKELEKFNNTLFSEIQALESSTVGKGEIKKLKTLKKEFSYIEKDKSNLGV
ncbi:MAG: AAA family ATPase [Candidatus Pacebacteria bacterium]|nr:AAA family ATPase [Candidatus Paceibacterota bacterium]